MGDEKANNAAASPDKAENSESRDKSEDGIEGENRERKQSAESESGALSGESKQDNANGVEADDEKSGGSEGGKIGEKADGIESELKQEENGGTTDNPTDFSPSVLVTKESDSQKELSDVEVENGAPSSTGVVSTM